MREGDGERRSMMKMKSFSFSLLDPSKDGFEGPFSTTISKEKKKKKTLGLSSFEREERSATGIARYHMKRKKEEGRRENKD
jgi:hypothetical protein